jgi:hypothetical protein
MQKATYDGLKNLVVDLGVAQNELRQIIEDQELSEDQAGEQPTDPGPYQGALDYVFDRTHNGNLEANDLTVMKAEWINAVMIIEPITKEMHTGGLSFWVRAGGLVLRVRGEAIQAFRAIRNKWYAIAADRAKEERRLADWDGPNHLTSPDGKQKGPNGQYFGPFTRPGDEA